jgi:MoaA/NifB/PqqE/SkfB family radical SAM enzyme
MTIIDHIINDLKELHRRVTWYSLNIAFAKAINLASTVLRTFLKTRKSSSCPSSIKIDISPLCNLHCTICIHSHPSNRKELINQKFNSKMKMSIADYKKIINEIAGKCSIVILYYLGDPLMHPEMDEMCRIAHNAGLNIHINTNFNFTLSDERMLSIIKSGVTHFTVCVDGLSQNNYSKTRVGGNIDKVLYNLRRLCEIKGKAGAKYPTIEVQYLKFNYNIDEIDKARKLLKEMGVNYFSIIKGYSTNYTDEAAEKLLVNKPRSKRLVMCHWPYSTMVIKYNGDVIPCCYYRMDEQYNNVKMSPILGNVFESSVKEVWNNTNYQKLRQFVASPQADTSHANIFCYKCPVIFETKYLNSPVAKS